MRVNLSSLYAGPRGSWGPGVCDLPTDIGEELIEAGVAIPVKIETRSTDADAPVVEDGETSEESEENFPVRRGPRRSQAGKSGHP